MLLISDANILIDMKIGGLLDELFLLEETVAVPDILFEDELRELHPELPEKGLKLLSIESEGMERVTALRDLYSKPSPYDLAAWVLAEQRSCPLLTGDKALRSAAENEGLEVHGTLWIMDRLLSAGIVEVNQVAVAYETMRQESSHLPWAEVNNQLREYCCPQELMVKVTTVRR